MKTEIDCGIDDPAVTTEYERLAARIEAGKERQAEALFDIGLALVEAKKRLEHGTFLQFLRDDRVNYGERTAQILMQIAKAEDGRALANLGVAKAVQMLRINFGQRDQLFRQHRLSDLSVSRLRGLVDGMLGRRPSFRAARKPSSADSSTPIQIAWAAGVLQLSVAELSAGSIQRGFRELAHVFHPDKGFAPDGKFFRTILQARDILLKFTAKSARAA